MLPPHLVADAAADLGATLVEASEYDAHRIALGAPRGGLDFHYGDAEAVKKAFAAAAHVTRLEIVSNRIVVNPMEPRSAIGSRSRT